MVGNVREIVRSRRVPHVGLKARFKEWNLIAQNARQQAKENNK